jgi:hypothetical protein
MKNDQLVQTIQRLFAAEDKPSDMTPAALLLTIRLLVQGADERDTNVSQGTLAEQFRCSESLIYETTKLLKRHDWIAVRSGKNKSKPNRMQVRLDKLPLSSELRRTIVSDEMKQMALSYKMALVKIKPNRRFAKGALQGFAFRLQWMLENKCAGDAKLLTNVINFAFSSPMYHKKALRGPHELRRNWKALFAAYTASNGAKRS